MSKKKKIKSRRPFIDISEVFLGCFTEKAEVTYLVFPNLTNSPKTSYVRISKNEALKKLLPCMYDPFSNFERTIELRKLIFEFAYNLVSESKCFNLFLGRDSSELRNSIDFMSKM